MTTLCEIAPAQNGFELRGGSMQGVGDGSLAPIAGGLLDIWDARTGIVTAGTNVQSWKGINGSGYIFTQYSFNNQPALVNPYTTNNFPAVVFETTGANKSMNMTAHSLAALFTGNQSFTAYLLACGQTNDAPMAAVAFGWSGATNTAASLIHFRPNNSVETSHVLGMAQDTNSTIVTVSVATSTTTNVYSWNGFSVSNGVYTCMNNLKTTVNTKTLGVQTLDTCSLGLHVRANYALSSVWRGGITCLVLITNIGKSPTEMTNDMNYLNTKYNGGLYKCY